MYADNTLTPKEAARLCALGVLADGPVAYSELAVSVRYFMDRVLGPSLDVLGASLELLTYEGLVETDNTDGNAVLSITGSGQDELHTLLTANIRPGATDINKLIVALKFRFMHLLDAAEQQLQAEALVESTDTELTRLLDLRSHLETDQGFLLGWLDRQISELESHADWLGAFKERLSKSE